jgi:magnesium-protoporphyrin IX monomethyl ester (oxidative) cyclase
MNVVRLRFDRFSMYHERPERWGLELAPYRTYAYVYPVPIDVLSDLAYFFESKEDLARDDVTPEMMAGLRPGLEAVREWVFDWMRVKHRPLDQRPVLMMTDDGVEIRIRDTRSVATRSHHVLRGLARLVYLTCDDAIAAEGLVAALNRRFDLSATWSDAAPVVDDLVANKLMLAVESRYLSLATWEGRDVAASRISPFGGLDFERAAQDLGSRSLAEACRYSPESVTVQELFAV